MNWSFRGFQGGGKLDHTEFALYVSDCMIVSGSRCIAPKPVHTRNTIRSASSELLVSPITELGKVFLGRTSLVLQA